MLNPFFIAAFLATAGSVIWLTKIAIRHHSWIGPKALSEIATVDGRVLALFRRTLIICASLFTVSIYGFIAPRLNDSLFVIIIWTWVYVSIVVAALLPMRGNTYHIHVIAAQSMGAGMLVLGYVFWRSLEGAYSIAELTAAVTMTALAVLTYVDKRRYIIHELAFIYMNHVTIIIAALAVLH